ncbi:MAG: hypothetical protein K9G41_01750 [Flavobacteriales bacterium]|nr:hypothetical protein [Flavobacteriales bacterium]
MKRIVLLLVLGGIMSIAGSGCRKEATVYGCMDPSSANYNPDANVDNGTCQYTGSAVFWYNSTGTTATVNVGGQTGYITQYYSSYDPGCGSGGCANFTLPTGTYSFYASSTFSTWSGNVTITKNGCSKMLLY